MARARKRWLQDYNLCVPGFLPEPLRFENETDAWVRSSPLYEPDFGWDLEEKTRVQVEVVYAFIRDKGSRSILGLPSPTLLAAYDVALDQWTGAVLQNTAARPYQPGGAHLSPREVLAWSERLEREFQMINDPSVTYSPTMLGGEVSYISAQRPLATQPVSWMEWTIWPKRFHGTSRPSIIRPSVIKEAWRRDVKGTEERLETLRQQMQARPPTDKPYSIYVETVV